MTHLLLWGNAYAQIIRNGKNAIVALYPLMPNKMSVDRDENGRLYYTYYRGSDEAIKNKEFAVTLQPSDVLHIPGLGFDGLVSPYDADLLRFSRKVEQLFRYLYDDVPMPENFGSLRELDLADREQVRDIFKASGWLFWNSYFLRPVSKYAYEPEISDDDELTIEETLTNEQRLRTTFEQPTGPLALYVNEWLQLMVDNKMPRQRKQDKGIHKYYQQFNNATGGKKLAFFGTYAELNAFLSEKMGWGNPAEGNLPQLKDYGNFVVFGNREKGIIIAPEVAQYVSHPDNPCYDTATAAAEAHLLLMQPGRCPIDLVKHLFENGYVPDASFPAGNNAHTLLHDNWDFIARLYLCKYYRAD